MKLHFTLLLLFGLISIWICPVKGQDAGITVTEADSVWSTSLKAGPQVWERKPKIVISGANTVWSTSLKAGPQVWEQKPRIVISGANTVWSTSMTSLDRVTAQSRIIFHGADAARSIALILLPGFERNIGQVPTESPPLATPNIGPTSTPTPHGSTKDASLTSAPAPTFTLELTRPPTLVPDSTPAASEITTTMRDSLGQISLFLIGLIVELGVPLFLSPDSQKRVVRLLGGLLILAALVWFWLG